MKLTAPRHLPPTIQLLAEHLDAMLAAGEDLAALTFDPSRNAAIGIVGSVSDAADGWHETDETRSDMGACVAKVRIYERTLVLRTLSARRWADVLRDEDPRFRAIIDLFVGGTAQLVDAAELTGISDGDRAAQPACDIAYLRSRGSLTPECAGVDPFKTVNFGDNFLIAETIPLAGLMDMTASFLDQLETHYDVFPELSEVTGQPMPTDDLDRDSRSERSVTRSLKSALASLQH